MRCCMLSCLFACVLFAVLCVLVSKLCALCFDVLCDAVWFEAFFGVLVCLNVLFLLDCVMLYGVLCRL